MRDRMCLLRPLVTHSHTLTNTRTDARATAHALSHIHTGKQELPIQRQPSHKLTYRPPRRALTHMHKSTGKSHSKASAHESRRDMSDAQRLKADGWD